MASVSTVLSLAFGDLYTSEIKDSEEEEVKIVQNQLDSVKNEAVSVQSYLDLQVSNAAKLEEEKNSDLLNRTGLLSSIDVPTLQSSLEFDSQMLSRYRLVDPKLIMDHQRAVLDDRTLAKDVKAHLKKAVRSRGSRESGRTSTSPGWSPSATATSRIQSAAILPLTPFTLGFVASPAASSVKDLTKAKESKLRLRQAQMKMTGETLNKNKDILKRMKNKLEYTKNPRYCNKSMLHRAEAIDMTLENNYFRMEPPIVTFTDYIVGSVYQIPLSITNVSSLGRRLRVLPIESNYFAVDGIEYPSETGLLAPGASVIVRIRFRPVSLADFETYLLLQTEAGQFDVLIEARRAEPKLSLAPILNVGCCYVNETVSVSFACNNSGGPTSFALFPTEFDKLNNYVKFREGDEFYDIDGILSEQDESNFYNNFHVQLSTVENRENQNNENVISNLGNIVTKFNDAIGPFLLSPTLFSLDRDEEMVLTVQFTPSEAGVFEKSFYFLCNNARVYRYTLYGQAWKINVAVINYDGMKVGHRPPLYVFKSNSDEEINTSESIESVPLPLSSDVPDLQQTPNPKLLKFPDALLDYRPSSSVSLSLANYTPVPVVYRWQFADHDLNSNSGRFVIEPNDGVLGPFGQETFHITYLTHFEENISRVAQFILENIPAAQLTSDSISSVSENQKELIDFVYCEFDLVARATAIRFNVAPQLIEFIKTPILLGTVVECRIVIYNNSAKDCPCKISSALCTGLLLNVSTNSCTVSANSSTDITLFIEPTMVATLHGQIIFSSEFANSICNICVCCVGPEIVVETSLIDFELLNFGIPDVFSSKTFSFYNPNKTSVRFSLLSDENGPNFDGVYCKTDSVLSFSPAYGIVNPNSSISVSVTYKPKQIERFRTTIPLYIENGGVYNISARGEVQAPNVVLSTSKLALGTCYVSITNFRTVILNNISNLPALYSFENQDNSVCKITFSPKNGQLLGKSSISINIEYTFYQSSRNESPTIILCGCDIEGRLHPIGLKIEALVKDLVVSCHISKQSQLQEKMTTKNILSRDRAFELGCPPEHEASIAVLDELYPVNDTVFDVDFGNDCSINSQFVKRVVFRNHTAIPTYIDLFAETLGSDNADALRALVCGDYNSLTAKVPENSDMIVSEDINNRKTSTRNSTAVSLSRTNSAFSMTGNNPKLKALTSKWNASVLHLANRPLLTDSHQTLLRFQSRKGQDFVFQKIKQEKIREILKMGQGVAFAFNPESCLLPAWEAIEVEIHVFTGMCGFFSDKLRARISGTTDICLNSKLNVIGSPLTLSPETVGLSFDSDIPKLIFNRDSYPIHSGSFEKLLKVKNSGPFDLKLRWKIFSESDDDSNVGLELNVENEVVKINLQGKEQNKDFYFYLPETDIIVKARSCAHIPIVFKTPDHGGNFKAFMNCDIFVRDSDKDRLSSTGASLTETTVLGNKWIPAPSVLANSPLELFLLASTATPILTIDQSLGDMDLMKFVVKAHKKVKKQEFVETISFVNKSGSILDFTVEVSPPEFFVLAAFDSTALVSKPLIANAAALLSTSASLPAVVGRSHDRRTNSARPSSKGSQTSSNSQRSSATVKSNITHRSSLTHVSLVNDTTSIISSVSSQKGVSKTNQINFHLSTAAKPFNASPENQVQLFTLPNLRQFYLAVQFKSPSIHGVTWPQSNFYSIPHIINGEIKIRHANGDEQIFPIVAELHRPTLFVQPSILKFPITYCARRNVLILNLYNSSIVPLVWNLVHIKSASFSKESAMHPSTLLSLNNSEFNSKKNFEDDPSVFSFSELTGTVNPMTLPPSGLPAVGFQVHKVDNRVLNVWDKGREPFELNVYFVPKKEVSYHSKFRFQVECGESLDIEIFGDGSFDEQYMKFVL